MATLSDLLASWLDLRWTFDPALATRAGSATHGGRLPGLDAEAIKLQLAGLRSLASAVELLEVEDDAEEIHRTALLDVLRAEQFRLENEIPQRKNPAAWLGALGDAWQSLRAHPFGTQVARAQFALERLDGTAAMLERAGKTVKSPAGVFTEEALALAPVVRLAARELATDAAQWLPELSEQLHRAADEAELAVAAFESKLREDLTPSAAPSAYAIGREAYDHRLHFEHALRPTAPELWRWSQHTLTETRELAVAAAKAAGLGEDLSAAAKMLRAQRPAGDPQAEVLRGLARARKWVEGKGLMPLPAAELRVLEMPEHVQVLGGRVRFDAEDVVYIRPPSATTPVSAPELLVDVLLELCPGRLTHRSLSRTLLAKVPATIATPFATDGWSLYGLDLALEHGFTDDPLEIFAIRLAQLHAIARGVVDLGLHTEGFTPLSAAELLTQLLPLDRSEALTDVRRAAAWPTYSLAASVGRREIMELREAWRARRQEGKTASGPVSQFHSELLAYGGLPISLARWGMDLGLEE